MDHAGEGQGHSSRENITEKNKTRFFFLPELTTILEIKKRIPY